MKAIALFLLLLTGCGTSNPAPTPSPSPTPTVSASPTPAPSPTPSPSPKPSPTASPRPSGANNLTVCPSSTLPGIDVSDYDPNSNWPTIKKSQSFAFIKATEGLSIGSATFAGDWASSKLAGVTRGAYHYLHPNEDPIAQANFYLKTVGALGMADLPPMLDWEETDSTSTAADIAAAQSWLDQVEGATGKVPVIYVDPSFYNALGNPQQFFRYPLFVADWGVKCPDIPPPWSTWMFWQWNANGTVNGMTNVGGADQDWFNGSSL